MLQWHLQGMHPIHRATDALTFMFIICMHLHRIFVTIYPKLFVCDVVVTVLKGRHEFGQEVKKMFEELH